MTGPVYGAQILLLFLVLSFVREALIKSGPNRLLFKLFWFKAWNARNSRAIAKFHNAESGQFKQQDVGSRLNQSFLNCFRQIQITLHATGIQHKEQHDYRQYIKSSHSI
ncbi:MAG: hypothetical protein COA54_12355 [Thiotrichaceae bacterium]|nr:MAG: hypothetical protein COA54_12355 [Thiotrichaceae bacterium]